RERNYPEQPPTIPHSIVGYRIDKDSNKCLSCHSRANSARTQAVMISITHYMDRDGQPLAAVSPRRRERNYPEQPPTIPHSIVGYRIDKDSNKCLSCHSRANSARTQAVMISITHYMDRDGQPLAAVSPRRYFCVQCHVPQQDVKPLVDNRFENIDQILEKEAANAARKP
uniref:nitrate reductase cytochrome c-type subunit n=1 Tax=Pseudomonas aeruginosa TaxID=287 RepID=UPI0024430233